MKSAMTEQRIMAAAMDVLEERSISGSRVHLIAEKAGIVQSNLHYYFKTKGDLLMALLEQMLQNFHENRKNMIAESKPNLDETLETFFEQKKRIIKTESRNEFIQMDFWAHSHVDGQVQQFFSRSYNIWRSHIVQTLDEYLPDIGYREKKLLAGTMVSMMMGASLQALVDDSAFDLDDYFDLCLAMVMNAARQFDRAGTGAPCDTAAAPGHTA